MKLDICDCKYYALFTNFKTFSYMKSKRYVNSYGILFFNFVHNCAVYFNELTYDIL